MPVRWRGGQGGGIPDPPRSAAAPRSGGSRSRSRPRGAAWPREGRSLPDRQSERCLPSARANQRPANVYLNAVPGSHNPRCVTERGWDMAPCTNQTPESDDWQAVKPTGLPRVTRRFPAERLAAAGTPRGQSEPPGAGVPGRGAAAAMAGGARGGAGTTGAGPGRGGAGGAGPARRGASPRRGSSSWEVRGAGPAGLLPRAVCAARREGAGPPRLALPHPAL